MPAVINIAANLLLGAGLALALRRSPAQRQELLSWPLLCLLAFEALVVTPVATYLFRFYPQWSMLYWFDPQIFTELERWVGPLSGVAVLLNFAAALGGYVLARRGIITDTKWMVTAPITGATVTLILCTWLFGRRIAFIGDYDAFWSGHADLIFLRTPGIIGVGTYLLGIVFVVWLHARFRDHDPSLI
jgi:hypothetical protein